MIEVHGLTVGFPLAARPVLHAVDLEVRAGERVLLLGPSGSGKSTLLRVLAGIVPQSVDAHVDGTVDVAGLPVLAGGTAQTAVHALARRVATLTQSPADQLCLPTVQDEVAFALENRAVPPAEIGPRVRAALAAVGAGHLAGRRTSELSGGEGQRVALAASLVAEPRVLLLDEPTALLDPAGARRVGEAIAATGGRTSVLVEHRLDELPALPHRVVVLDATGRVRADGPTAEVLHDEAGPLRDEGIWLPLAEELHAAGARSLADLGVGTGTAAEARTAAGPAAGVPGRTSARTPVLAASHLSVRRGGRTVLQDVSLEVRAGRVCAVVGLNGSGKSTLLLALAGLLPLGRAERGRISGGSVGMVFQQPEHQLLCRSVRDEVAYGPGRARLRDVPARVEEALRTYALTGLEDRDPFRLSGGEQRRLSLAALAVCDHDVLLADEPTFGQDRCTTRATAAALRALADEGRGVVVVTHDLRLVGLVADDVLVLRAGRVAAYGPVASVLGDRAALAGAGLHLPALLAAWHGTGLALRPLLTALDGACLASAAR